jgi:SOS-response transcriptional repressor LexA
MKNAGAEIASRIKQLRKNLGLTQPELAKTCGVSQVAVSHWERSTAVPTAQILLVLARLDSDHREWWLARAGMRPEDLEARGGEAGPSFRSVPLLKDAVAAGTPRAIDETQILNRLPIPSDWLPPGGHIVAVRVDGDSMSPIIEAGYVVLIDTSQRDPKKLVKEMVAAREEDGVTIKWLRKDGPHYLLVPQHTSPRNPVRVLSPEGDFGIVGKVLKWIGQPPKK